MVDSFKSDSIPSAYPADFYNKFWQKSDRLNYAEVYRIYFIVESIKEFIPAGNLKILDYGCGRGWMAPYLAEFGNVTGVDFGFGGIELARKKYGHLGKFFVLRHEKLSEELKTFEGQFDLIVCSEVIEHVTDQAGFLTQSAKLLKPQGFCVLTTPNGLFWPAYKSREILLKRLLGIRSYLQPVENWLTPQSLKDYLDKAQFGIHRHTGMISHQTGMPPWGGLIRLEWYWRKLLSKATGQNKMFGALRNCLYQGVVCQKS
jgi:2-polyprenyl-3-methyl-5-hydroxy-6-metoxy-1,4-benzoquinol methylase